MITFDPITLHRGYADWGLPMSHVITRQGADPYDRRGIIAEIPSVQPYCMGATPAEIAYADTQLAYATLFAAAPDLLSALVEVLGWNDDADNPHKPIEVRAAYMRAHAAIAKANGKETA